MLYFLRFILIFFLVLTILGYVLRLLLKLFLKRLEKKMNFQQEEDKGKKVGDAYIKGNPKKEKIVNKSVGDYIDYEEINAK